MLSSRGNTPPWFLQPPLTGGATVVDVSWASVAPGARGDTTYVSTDVPAADFVSMIERAAKHAGYKGSQRDYREFRVGDTSYSVAGGSPQADAASFHFACERRELCEVREIPGTPLVVRTYRRERLPFAAFPCDAEPDVVRRVRRLELRTHARARLIFDASADESSNASNDADAHEHQHQHQQIRTVRLEIDIGGGGRGGGADDAEDLRRTTENTIQNVLLRMKPRRPPRV